MAGSRNAKLGREGCATWCEPEKDRGKTGEEKGARRWVKADKRIVMFSFKVKTFE